MKLTFCNFDKNQEVMTSFPVSECWQYTSSIITLTYKSLGISCDNLAPKYAVVETLSSRLTSKADVKRRRCLTEGNVKTLSETI